ncbi:CD40 ligand [Paramormyrops kingsleyae]|uniref:CD40 ligand n=1 Tax=Paramormyrops kingsleyae TaxID=1676925 RepID=A0A3B3TEG3_9TELE|nr:CD40 ligand-like [Paramormyrops kingsleyae]
MINTYTTSFIAPPVPPRTSSRAPAPTRHPVHLWLLSVVLVLQMIVFAGTFVYLFLRDSELQREFESQFHDDLIVLRRLQECDDRSLEYSTLLDCKKILDKYKNILLKISQAEGSVGLRLGDTPIRKPGAMAHMLVKPDRSQVTSTKVLQWYQEHSLLMNVDYLITPRTLRIRFKGHYYIYSQVTFSGWHPKIPLVQTVMRQATAAGKKTEDVLLKAFCTMKNAGEACTSFQGGTFQLEEGMELYVNVTDINLLNFEETATTFGLFMV